VELKLEVVTLAVGDVDEALAFYTEKVGFRLDVDYGPTENFRVVQLTPPGSSCSVQFGVGLTDSDGATRSSYLVVTDIEAARRELVARGVEVSAIRHKAPVEEWAGGFADGPDPERRDYASMAEFADPAGNTWVLQEIGFGRGQS
jgi:catechol 2,3-dioxygenase-like lactoylglutathione lyase family enzyme